MSAQADLVVTGDHHLLALKEFEGIPLVRLAVFLDPRGVIAGRLTVADGMEWKG